MKSQKPIQTSPPVLTPAIFTTKDFKTNTKYLIRYYFNKSFLTSSQLSSEQYKNIKLLHLFVKAFLPNLKTSKKV